MQCPVCRERPARRGCPALGRQICAVCCGTKRLSEIACPPDCGYLAAAQAHPAAAVRRQQERDFLVMSTLLDGLTPPQKELAWAVLGFVSRFAADPLLRLHDEDVADMAAALASTLQTAARGVIYEHRPRTIVAQRLGSELKGFLEQLERQAERRVSGDAIAVLQRLEKTFKDAATITGERGTGVGLAAAARVLRAAETSARAEAVDSRVVPSAASNLVIP